MYAGKMPSPEERSRNRNKVRTPLILAHSKVDPPRNKLYTFEANGFDLYQNDAQVRTSSDCFKMDFRYLLDIIGKSTIYLFSSIGIPLALSLLK